LEKLASDTGKLGKRMQRHAKWMEDAAKSKEAVPAKRKQQRANKAAKTIDRSAIFIEKRAELLEALVKDITRNYSGLISVATFQTNDDLDSGRSFLETLEGNRVACRGASGQVRSYRDSVRNVERQNLSRTMRISSKWLGDSLDATLKILAAFEGSSRRLYDELGKKLEDGR
jgi:hypothetical protein